MDRAGNYSHRYSSFGRGGKRSRPTHGFDTEPKRFHHDSGSGYRVQASQWQRRPSNMPIQSRSTVRTLPLPSPTTPVAEPTPHQLASVAETYKNCIESIKTGNLEKLREHINALSDLYKDWHTAASYTRDSVLKDQLIAIKNFSSCIAFLTKIDWSNNDKCHSQNIINSMSKTELKSGLSLLRFILLNEEIKPEANEIATLYRIKAKQYLQQIKESQILPVDCHSEWVTQQVKLWKLCTVNGHDGIISQEERDAYQKIATFKAQVNPSRTPDVSGLHQTMKWVRENKFSEASLIGMAYCADQIMTKFFFSHKNTSPIPGACTVANHYLYGSSCILLGCISRHDDKKIAEHALLSVGRLFMPIELLSWKMHDILECVLEKKYNMSRLSCIFAKDIGLSLSKQCNQALIFIRRKQTDLARGLLSARLQQAQQEANITDGNNRAYEVRSINQLIAYTYLIDGDTESAIKEIDKNGALYNTQSYIQKIRILNTIEKKERSNQLRRDGLLHKKNDELMKQALQFTSDCSDVVDTTTLAQEYSSSSAPLEIKQEPMQIETSSHNTQNQQDQSYITQGTIEASTLQSVQDDFTPETKRADQLKELSDQNRLKDETIHQVSQELSELKARNVEITKQLEEAQSTIGQISRHNATLEELEKKHDQQAVEYSRLVEEAQALNTKLQEEMNDISKRAQHQLSQYKVFQGDISGQKQIIRELNELKDNLQEQLVNHEAKIKILEDKIEFLHDSINAYLSSMDDYFADAFSNDNISAKPRRVAATNQPLKDKLRYIQDTATRLDSSRKSVQAAKQSTIDDQCKTIAENELTIENLKSKQRKITKQAEQTKQQKDTTIDSLTSELELLKKEYNKLRGEIDEKTIAMQAFNDEATRERNNLQEIIQSLQNELKYYQENLDQVNCKVSEYTQVLEEKKEIIKTLEDKVLNITRELDQTHAQNTQEKKDLLQQLNQKKEEIDRIRDKYQSMKENFEDLAHQNNEKLKEQKTKIEKFEKLVALSENKLKTSQEEHMKELKQLRESHERLASSSRQEIAEKQNAIEKLKQDINEAELRTKELKRQLESTNSKSNQQEREIKSKSETIDSYDQIITKKESAIDFWQRKHSEQKNNLRVLQEELEQLKLTLKQKDEHFQLLQQQLEKQKVELKSKNNKIEELDQAAKLSIKTCNDTLKRNEEKCQMIDSLLCRTINPDTHTKLASFLSTQDNPDAEACVQQLISQSKQKDEHYRKQILATEEKYKSEMSRLQAGIKKLQGENDQLNVDADITKRALEKNRALEEQIQVLQQKNSTLLDHLRSAYSHQPYTAAASTPPYATTSMPAHWTSSNPGYYPHYFSGSSAGNPSTSSFSGPGDLNYYQSNWRSQ